jgi:hypothetical protein
MNLERIITKIKILGEKFGESWTACALIMVQGDLAVFSMKHAIIASKVGIITGIAFMGTSFFAHINNRWGNAAMTGILTALADLVIHPTNFGPNWAEAAVTGLGASILALVFITILKKTKQNWWRM